MKKQLSIDAEKQEEHKKQTVKNNKGLLNKISEKNHEQPKAEGHKPKIVKTLSNEYTFKPQAVDKSVFIG